MVLIKENKEKQRAVYKLEDRYRKVWYFVNEEWLDDHIEMLKEVNPGYVLNYGINVDTDSMFVEYKIISGVPANMFEHTEEFINKIYNFCIDSINSTAPYAHGDWVLSNIIIDGDALQLVDWDNLGVYPAELVLEKIGSDLKSAFGGKFDPASL